MTEEVAIRFYAIKGCPHILQAPAHCASILTAGSVPGMKIIAVLFNGKALKFRFMDDITVCVSPMLLLEGGRVELRCLAPKETSKPLQRQPATCPSPDIGYGLQAPSQRNGGGSQWAHR